MFPCEEYSGIPGSKQPGSQPFSIKMSKEALIVMDIHSHLLSTEVIGFLGGIWNPTEKVLEITQALPCKSIENIAKELQKKSDDYTETKTENKKKNLNEDRHYNVELCPTSEVQIRDYCEQHNLTIVGWYHSHPTFRPDPSLIDLFNQRNYQSLFRSTNSEEPFVGAIVSPYDSRQQSSSFNWFNVGNEQGNMNRPKHLRYELKVFDSLGDLEIEKIIKLVNESGKRGDRVDFGKPWRKDGNQSRLEKIVKAMMEHFDPESLEMTKLVHSLVTEIKKWE
jgi:protein MYSM1